MQVSDIQQQIKNLFICESSFECLGIAESLGQELSLHGINIELEWVLKELVAATLNKKSGLEREGGLLGIAGVAKGMKETVLPYLVPLIPIILESQSDKGVPVREAAHLAMTNILDCVCKDAISILMPTLLQGTRGKWQSKIATLKYLESLIDKYPQEICELMPMLIPEITNCLHDTKSLVSEEGIKTMIKVCQSVGNPDIEPHIKILVDCMAHPDQLSEAVKTISSTTFVAEVTGPALALMVPLLIRALNDRSVSMLRSTVIIADNLFKLVRNPKDAGQFLPQIMPGLDRIIDTAAFPEIRNLANRAKTTLVKAAAANQGGFEFNVANIESEKQIKSFLAKKTIFITSFYNNTVQFASQVISNLIKRECFKLQEWEAVLVPILKGIMNEEFCKEFIQETRMYYHEGYKKSLPGDVDDDPEGEVLCDIEFSLAYGRMMLLNNTMLKLKRGMRYGLCGHNGAGKSTLLRAIANGKVDGFPSPEQLKCVFVCHDLQGSDTEISVVEFLATDPEFTNVKRSQVEKTLLEVGFTDVRQKQAVGSLSGGWKMKLELARAMLLNADILLLDEPTNHLVFWLNDRTSRMLPG